MAIKITVGIVLAVCAIIVLNAIRKSEKTFKSIMTSILQGIASLMAVNVIGLFSGVTLAVNWYTLGTVALLGMPGTIMLTVLEFILK